MSIPRRLSKMNSVSIKLVQQGVWTIMTTVLTPNTKRYISYTRLYRKAVIHHDRAAAKRYKELASKFADAVVKEKKKGGKVAAR
jgi:hypothetical protein